MFGQFTTPQAAGNMTQRDSMPTLNKGGGVVGATTVVPQTGWGFLRLLIVAQQKWPREFGQIDK